MMAINNNIAMSYLFIWFFFCFTLVERGNGGRGKRKTGRKSEERKGRKLKFPHHVSDT